MFVFVQFKVDRWGIAILFQLQSYVYARIIVSKIVQVDSKIVQTASVPQSGHSLSARASRHRIVA